MNQPILIISYYWYPALGPAVQRWSVFVDELEKAGFAPQILTVKDGTHSASDPDYKKDSESENIIRTSTREPFKVYNWLRGQKNKSSVGLGDASSGDSLVSKLGNVIRANLFIPDARVGWVPFAFKKAEELIREQKIHQIITTGPPHSTHLIGKKLKQKYPNLNWLADFRDPWVNVYYNRHLMRIPWAWKKDKKLETSVLKAADQVIVISEGMKREFADRAQNIETVMNGYNEHDFQDKPVSKKEKDFIVRYTGNFTDNQIVDEIWEAFSMVVDEHPLGNHIRFRFTGNVSQGIVDAMSRNGLEDRLETQDYCPHEEAVQKMINSDLLLLIIPRSPNNELIITAKIFEYLASGSPILGVGPTQGDAAHVLDASERPAMFDYEDKEEIQDFIESQLEGWAAAKLNRPKVRSQAHRQFSRNAQAMKLIDILLEAHNKF